MSLLLGHSSHSQAQATSPSLTDTLDWIANTLKPSEKNNVVTHRPEKRPYPRDWDEKGIDPYHTEEVKAFSHDACRITLQVETVDNDMGFSLGRQLLSHYSDTFDLKDIDPKSVRIQDSCEPVEGVTGPTRPQNCEDTQGEFVLVQTADAKPKIHEESVSTTGYSAYGWWKTQEKEKNNLQEMCKLFPGNITYCEGAQQKSEPKDITSVSVGFSTPDYATRFAKAFRHAVELCGGKPSAF